MSKKYNSIMRKWSKVTETAESSNSLISHPTEWHEKINRLRFIPTLVPLTTTISTTFTYFEPYFTKILIAANHYGK